MKKKLHEASKGDVKTVPLYSCNEIATKAKLRIQCYSLLKERSRTRKCQALTIFDVCHRKIPRAFIFSRDFITNIVLIRILSHPTDIIPCFFIHVGAIF